MNIKRILLLVFGFTFLTLGAIGMILPILPTTPFVLLAGGCFSGSNKKMENWIKKNKYFGYYLENYQKGTGVPMKIKIKSITYLWISLLLCFYFIHITWVIVLISIIGSLVTIYLLSLKNKVE